MPARRWGTPVRGWVDTRVEERLGLRATLLPLDTATGYWFAGLADGEGCFSISSNKNGSYRCDFILKLRADDLPLLEKLQEHLGMGRIGIARAGRMNPCAVYTISKKAELQLLTEILDAFPLRSKKARDYRIWREAVIHWFVSDPPVDWEPMREAFEALRDVRAYQEPVRG